MGFTDLLMANSIVGIFKSIIFATVGFQDVFVSFIHHFPRGMALPSPTAGGQRAIIVRIIFNESDPKLLGVVVSRARNAPAMNARGASRRCQTSEHSPQRHEGCDSCAQGTWSRGRATKVLRTPCILCEQGD